MRWEDRTYAEKDDASRYRRERPSNGPPCGFYREVDEDYPVAWYWPHSGLGITSFVLSLLTGLLLFVLFAVAWVMEFRVPPGAPSPLPFFLALMISAGFLAGLVSLGLGIAGLYVPHRKKGFSALGTLFAFAILACVLVLMVIVMVMN